MYWELYNSLMSEDVQPAFLLLWSLQIRWKLLA